MDALLEFGRPNVVLGNLFVFCHNQDFSEIYVMIQTNHDVEYFDFINEKEVMIPREKIVIKESVGRKTKCHGETTQNSPCNATDKIELHHGFYVCPIHKDFFQFIVIDVNEKLSLGGKDDDKDQEASGRERKRQKTDDELIQVGEQRGMFKEMIKILHSMMASGQYSVETAKEFARDHMKLSETDIEKLVNHVIQEMKKE